MTGTVKHFVLALAIGAMGSVLVAPSGAAADSMTWKVKSNYKFKVQVAFYSQTRRHEWPGGGDAYDVNDYADHDFTIACNDGEKICLGAWATGNSKRYWGVGYKDAHGCQKCCYTCGGGPLPRQVLD